MERYFNDEPTRTQKGEKKSWNKTALKHHKVKKKEIEKKYISRKAGHRRFRLKLEKCIMQLLIIDIIFG